jgi:hypothetical protein
MAVAIKPTHPVELLCCAIATEEGWFDSDPTVIPRVRNNPGDIRFAHQIGASAPGWNGEPPAPIATCQSAAAGITILFRQIWEQVAEGQTVRQIISQFAPPNENETSVYIENVLKWTGLPADTPALELLPPLVQLDLP